MSVFLVTLRKWLVLVPLIVAISLGVTSLVLMRQRPIYEAEAILEYCRAIVEYGPSLFRAPVKEATYEMVMSNVIRVAISPELAIETCQKMGQPLALVTSCVVRTSAGLQQRSRLIRLTAEGYAPQIVTNYVNAWASALSSSLTETDKHVRVSVVEQAYYPSEPISPRWAETLLVAGAVSSGAGLICSCLAACLQMKRSQQKGPSAIARR